jgi:hypothetical protein
MAMRSIDAKPAGSAGSFVLLLALGWHLSAAPAAAAGIGSASLSSTGSGSAVLTFSHDGYKADNFPYGVAQGSRYRVCWRQLNQVGLACMYNALNTSGQQVLLTGLTAGLPINITIQCFCSRQIHGNLYGPPGDRVVVDMNYTHQLPPPVAGLVSSTNVRVRGVQSGQCLFINSTNSIVRGWSCWPDPAMVFALETFSDGSKRLHHVQSGLCIGAIGPIPNAVAMSCGGAGSRLTILPQPGSGNPVMVRFVFVPGGMGSWQTGAACLMANAANGQNATRQFCTGQPALLLMLDPV